jgi:hypothetical protein
MERIVESLSESALIYRLKAYYSLLPPGCMESLVNMAVTPLKDRPSTDTASQVAYTGAVPNLRKRAGD